MARKKRNKQYKQSDNTVDIVLREVIKCLLTESRLKQITTPKYRNLDAFLAKAPFMNLPAGDGEYDWKSGAETFSTSAVSQLQIDLNNYFSKNIKRPPVTAVVTTDEAETSVDEGPLKVAKGANYYFENGKHTVYILVAQLFPGEKFADLGQPGANRFAQIIRHELLHMNQFLKFSKGKPTNELYDEWMAEYKDEQAGGWKNTAYHTSDFDPSEREAFSHQIADELHASEGYATALKLLTIQGSIPHKQLLKLSDSYGHLVSTLPEYDTPDIRDALKRAKSYLKTIKRTS